jgi:hypothetical protein
MLEEMVPWQPSSAGSRPVPIGSRSIGVSLQPAIPRRVAPQQGPLPLRQSPTIVAQSQCGVWLRASVALVVSAPKGVSSLLCAQGDISTLRRQAIMRHQADIPGVLNQPGRRAGGGPGGHGGQSLPELRYNEIILKVASMHPLVQWHALKRSVSVAPTFPLRGPGHG